MNQSVTATFGGHTSPAYIAPEMISNKIATTQVDMWALGIILYQLVSSYNHPFQGENFFSMIDQIKYNEPAPIPATVSPYIKKTITRLLDKNPESRPNAENLLNEVEMFASIKKVIS